MGRWAEWLAAGSLMLRGYRILALRYRTRVGEIDIIARRGRRIAFIEVKARAALDDALFAITPTLSRRVMAASEVWMRRTAARRPGDHAPAAAFPPRAGAGDKIAAAATDVSYDVIAVIRRGGSSLPFLRHIPRVIHLKGRLEGR
ncbi:MAG: YraN family protein [Pseudomonadota bacterium]